MRKRVLTGLVAVLLLVPSVPAMAGNVVKEEKSWPCDVSWTSGNPVSAGCEVVNTQFDNGGFTITLHGQIPDEHLAAFQASGVTDFATMCWVNFLFVVQDGQDPVTVSSVRHFTSGGAMTEHCHGLFSDTQDHLFEEGIEWMAFEGITKGCNPPTNDRYCPDDSVTRGQMAAFLVRALSYTDDGGGDLFIDDNGSVFEGDIDRLGTAGVTRGCNPPDNDRYCPDSTVTRGQMAAFLHRALS